MRRSPQRVGQSNRGRQRARPRAHQSDDRMFTGFVRPGMAALQLARRKQFSLSPPFALPFQGHRHQHRRSRRAQVAKNNSFYRHWTQSHAKHVEMPRIAAQTDGHLRG